MRNCVFAVALAISILLALTLCAPSVFGTGPAILDPPPYDKAFTPIAVTAFLVLWLSLIAMFTYVEETTFRKETKR